jgi:hypothetical protein
MSKESGVQKDIVNCGLFVVLLVDKLLSRNSFHPFSKTKFENMKRAAQEKFLSSERERLANFLKKFSTESYR